MKKIRMAARRPCYAIACMVGVLLAVEPAPAAECSAPKVVVTTVAGMKYCVDPAFDGVTASHVQRIRQDVRAKRQAGKLIV